ncbi:arabinan endo-1,5-alpha-L-arabinosidase [Actinoplanes campanulatus]|uniref:Arabinan endo-1,5-alpha-L-arabinosidase n=1 Tax=Actinoplanes campanulatus TaxID=113559 RepID=A0A7W5AHY4_9ACTN|nr:arabinan endo-1,5-alpha-L-arabinosidase [Actinoplanes campanulatus]MBB3096410.1 arabinan endo-1,5-alpha-L-arabinosidase [Actinoplanes campanulatus]GGN18512.1 arabinan endo-1,5-alpha-L-arabinosidase [Actinoplanes campanulatus]GID38476.1 arabinan endo-1,5-alpha-L-arabinosidase [Actinoplanes campanulatus]
MRIRKLLLTGVTGMLAVAAGLYGIQSASAATYPNPGVVTGSTGAHDPSLIKRPTGGYLLATTGDGITLKTSGDRTAFADAGKAFPNGTSWASTYTGGSANLWAPDLSYRNGRYWLYYSASTFGSSRSAIFLATSTTGAAGSWTHVGKVIESTTSSGWNAIDPNLSVTTSGEWYLTFGSFWTGIKMVKLSSSTGLRADSTMYNIAERFTNSKSVEAPFIHYRNGYYYLFMSFDFCCQGASSTYRTMVARSTSITGPYKDRAGALTTAGGGTEILASHDSIHGPGHPAVMTDSDADVLIYHYYNSSGAARLGINLLSWSSSGWPTVY